MIPVDVLSVMFVAAVAIGWSLRLAAGGNTDRCSECGRHAEWLHMVAVGLWVCERCCRLCPGRGR